MMRIARTTIVLLIAAAADRKSVV
jgi:hypothetical protein